MKMLKYVIPLYLLYVSPDALSQPCQSLNSLQWMLGDWVADNDKTVTRESWHQISAKTFEGFGESTNKYSNKRQSIELLRLVEMNDELFYIAKPQQNKLPVAFKLTYCNNQHLIFENIEHDFPKKLEYKLNKNNKMFVTVSGEQEKKFTIKFIKHDDN